MIAQPAPTHKPLQIRPDDQAIWQEALGRFIAHRLQLCPFPLASNAQYRIYDVTSFSDPTDWHEVELWRDELGAVETSCDCEGAVFGYACQHAAGALDDSGWAPFPLARQLGMEVAIGDSLGSVSEQPVSPARFVVGQAVKRTDQRRTTWWITDVRHDGKTWRYQVEGIDRQVVAAWQPEYTLTLATSKRSVSR